MSDDLQHIGCDGCGGSFPTMAGYVGHLAACRQPTDAEAAYAIQASHDTQAPGPRSYQGGEAPAQPPEAEMADHMTALFGQLRGVLAELPDTPERQNALWRLEEAAYWTSAALGPILPSG